MVFNCPECGKPAYQAPSNSTLVTGNVVVRKKRCRDEHDFLTVEAVIDADATLNWDDIVIKTGIKGDENGHLRPADSVQQRTTSSASGSQVAAEGSLGYRERAEV